MKKLILLFAFVLMAAPLFAQEDGGGGGGGIFGGGDLNASPNAPPPDRLVSLRKILLDQNAPLSPAQDKSLNAMIQAEIKKYTADLEKKFPDEVAAARAASAQRGPGGPGGGGGGGGRNAGGGAPGGGGGGGGRGPGGGGGRGGSAIPANGPLATEMARMNVELQAKVTDALLPPQQAAIKKYQTDLIRKAGGFAAMKLNMQEAGTPLTVEQESQIQALYNDQDQQIRQLTRDGGGTADPAKLTALKAQIGPKLLKVLNADQKKTLLDSMKKQAAPQG